MQELPFDTQIIYLDLMASGLLTKCKWEDIDFVMILPSEVDEDPWLCKKLKLFIPSIPLIYISSYIPAPYRQHLEDTGVEIIIDGTFSAQKLDEQIDKYRKK